MTDPTLPLKTFYRSLSGKGAMPLEYGDPAYVEMFAHDAGRDPIRHLAQRIDLAESESVNLLTGFRGNGKSTQLRRLQGLLRAKGRRVLLVGMKNFILLTKPLEVPGLQPDHELSERTALVRHSPPAGGRGGQVRPR